MSDAAKAARSEPSGLRTPLEKVRGIGAATAEGLRELGVRNIGQLVAYLPFKHEREEAETSIASLEADRLVSARGTVSATRIVRAGGRPRFEAVLTDDTGRLDLVWFNGLYLASTIHPGDRLRVQGKAKRRAHLLQIANPRYEVLKDGAEPANRDERLRPVYPASERLASRRIELAVRKVLEGALPLIEDHFTPEFLAERAMPGLAEAYRWVHGPESEEQAKAARRRLAYDELFLLQAALARRRARRERELVAPALPHSAEIDRRIRARLPFELTGEQERVIAEVAADLSRTVPANRLIQGDVGAGKTVVALYALLMAVAAKRQGALMAPTDLLAQQHYATIARYLAGSKVRVALLTGALSGAERERVRRGLAEGTIDLVVGTHALISGGVAFSSLAVAVIDEQHRFGVEQRAKLREKGTGGEGADSESTSPLQSQRTGGTRPSGGTRNAAGTSPLPSQRTGGTRGTGGTAGQSGGTPARAPHVLVMTATPIPRTLAMTLLGDLEVSTLRGLPPGRKPIVTRVVDPAAAEEVYRWVRTKLEAGERAYIVAPAIEAGDEPGALKSVTELHERLGRSVLSGRRLGLMHGRLPLAEREALMEAFRRGEVEALVSTTVIEVGVDVPEATVMVIEHAERFGLAQLHQLRGRVGRGGRRGYCVLVARAESEAAERRLAAMARSTDGFVLSEEDLKIRGFGEMAGVRQAGAPPFRVAQIPGDEELLILARRDAGDWAFGRGGWGSGAGAEASGTAAAAVAAGRSGVLERRLAAVLKSPLFGTGE